MVRYRTPQHTQTKKRGFTTKRAAEAFANTVEVEKLTGHYVAPSLGQVTLGELGEEWLARQAHHKASWSARLESAPRPSAGDRASRAPHRIGPSDRHASTARNGHGVPRA